MRGGKPDPKGARTWLHDYISSKQKMLKDYRDSNVDLREELLADMFPYLSGPFPSMLSGIASLHLLDWDKSLLEWAEETTAGYNFLRKVIADLVRSGQPVPKVWRHLGAGIIDGSITAPSERQGRGFSNDRRDELETILLIKLQSKFNLVRLANPLSRSGDSAIEIMHAELSQIWPNLKMVQLESIEKAILRRQKTRSSDPIIGGIDRQT